jgi:hypothetical protein
MEREQQPWRSFMASGSFISCWPPRSYPCSFCKREFRSAQALGGHMNVHRRDRVRLRHAAVSPPPPPAAVTPPPPVPNLNYPPPPPPPQYHHHRDGSGRKHSWMTDDVSLELGVGVLVSSCSTDPAAVIGGHDDDDAGLDLELRLGVS